jgi:hypothetical protein
MWTAMSRTQMMQKRNSRRWRPGQHANHKETDLTVSFYQAPGSA